MLFLVINSIIDYGDKMITTSNIKQVFLDKAIEYNPNEKDVKNLNRSINIFASILKYFAEQYKINTVDELYGVSYHFIDSIFKDVSEHKYIDSRLYELYTLEHLLKNKNLIKELYPIAKEQKNNHLMYDANIDRTQKLVLTNAIYELEFLENFTRENNITYDTDLDKHIKDNPQAKEHLLLIKNILKAKNVYDKLETILEFERKTSKEFIINNQKASLETVYKFFNTFRFDSLYLEQYNHSKEKFGFSELEYDISDIKNSFFNDNLTSSKKEGFRDLCFTNAFWFNRFAKECAQITDAFCAIDSFNLWPSILKGQTEFDIPREQLILSLKKTNFLKEVLEETYKYHDKNITSNYLKYNPKEVSLEGNYSTHYKKLHAIIQKAYNNYFYNGYLTNNDFFENAAFATRFVNLERFAYKAKDTTLEPLIENMLLNNHCKNWGIIRNELQNGKMVDSIANTERDKIVLAFDIEGFNMPFTFHIPKENLKKLVKASNTDGWIPEYQGYEDFIGYNPSSKRQEKIPSNFIAPIPKRLRPTIMENAKKDGPSKNLWEHFNYLMNGKFPKHLTQTIKSSNKKTVESRLPIYYTNIFTGKRATLENKKYKEVDDFDGR